VVEPPAASAGRQCSQAPGLAGRNDGGACRDTVPRGPVASNRNSAERPHLDGQCPCRYPSQDAPDRRFSLTLRPRSVTALRPMSSEDCALSSPGGWGRQAKCSQQVGLPGGTRDIRGDDVSGMPVQTATGTVVPHCCSRIRMRGGFLDIAQRDPGVQTGRERFTNPAEYLSLTSGR
jgi:hypothetical protein